MRKNKIRTLLAEGKVVTSGWLHIPSFWSAEVMAHAGFDAVAVDMQHGLMSIETAIQMMQAISTSDAVPLARATSTDPGGIMRLLDGGAYGVICPLINTADDCRRFISACRYPPLGIRSFGPTRAKLYGGADYAEYANEEIMTFAMIETGEAVDNIDEILSVEGLDAIFIGSGDLKLSLTGKAGHDNHPAEFDEAVTKVLHRCRHHNIIPGIWCATVADASRMAAEGFQFIAVKSDNMLLAESAAQTVKQLKTNLIQSQ